MKLKHVKSILTRKIDHWIKNIDDNNIKYIIKNNAIISGGAITSLIMGTKVNDYDVYFKTTDAAYQVAQYYIEKFKNNPTKLYVNKDITVRYKYDNETHQKIDQIEIIIPSTGVSSFEHIREVDIDPIEHDNDINDICVNKALDDIENNETTDITDNDKKELYRPVYITSNAITLTNDIQVIFRFTGEIREIHKNYDFTHCKCAYDYNEKDLFIHDEALECMINKELRYTTSKYPLCSLFRIRKFLERGWHINAGQILKIALDLNKLDLNNVEILHDQLIGVDHSYFRSIIFQLKSKYQNNEQIEQQYLIKLINYIF